MKHMSPKKEDPKVKRYIKCTFVLLVTLTVALSSLSACSSSNSAAAIPWEKYDSLVGIIRTESDPAKKEAFSHIAEDMLMETGCIVPLYELTEAHLIKDSLTGTFVTEYGARYFKSAESETSDAKLIYCEAPNSLDPAFASNIPALTLVSNLFAGLYTYDAAGNIVPDLVESVTVSDDGLIYAFKLRQSMTWSHTASSRLGASDFIYSWRRVADPETKSPYAYMFDIIARDEDKKLMMTADESDTVLTVTLSEPCEYFTELCAFPAFYPVYENSVEYAEGYKDLYGNIINASAWTKTANFPTTGAYFVSSLTENSSYTLTPNSRYHSPSKLKGISVTIKATPAEAYDAFVKGEATYVGCIPGGKLTPSADSAENNVKISDVSGTYVLCHNFNSKLYRGMSAEDAAAFRRAVSLYIDREYIVSSILGGYGNVATSIITDDVSDGAGGVYRKNTGYHRYPYMKTLGYISETTAENREEAHELIKSLGLDSDGDGKLDRSFSMTYLTVKTPKDILIAQSVQQDLAELGIVVKINAVDAKVFADEQDMFLYDIVSTELTATYDDPLSILEHFITDGSHNYAGLGAVVVEENENAY